MREGWLFEEVQGRSTSFTVTQRRLEPLRVFSKYAGIAVGVLVTLFVLFSIFPNGVFAVSALIALLAIFVMFFGWIGGFLLAIGAAVKRKAVVAFTVSASEILIKAAVYRNYPTQLPWEYISNIYVKRHPIFEQGIIASNPTVASGMQQMGKGFGEMVARSATSLVINYKGQEVKLADSVSDEEAEYLATRIIAARQR